MGESELHKLERSLGRRIASFLPHKWQTALFREVKLPGWILIAWGLFIVIPDIKDRLEFWWDAARYLGGNMEAITNLLTSPVFGIILILAGVAYLVFVEEERRPASRHKIWPIISWAVVGATSFAAFVVSIVSYVNAQIGPRDIYPKEREAITSVLREEKSTVPFVVYVDYIATCFDCDGYAFSFVDLINSVPGCGFRRLRPGIPIERGHAFRLKAATFSD
ncbi:MAG TPA: hypothetical protein VKW08_08900 [Xanthobacteraceae bacterium]|jgi:hypothetical protein|nr:hypothetical protein [Xanthobacteraceae bacterium]